MPWTETETDIMRDIFRLMRDHADARDTVEYWESMTDRVQQVLIKHRGHDMAVAFCVAACQYYESRLTPSQDR